MVNGYFIVVMALLVGHYLLETVADWLNLRHVSSELPAEFEGFYDAEKYRRSQRYLRDTTRLGIVAAQRCRQCFHHAHGPRSEPQNKDHHAG